MNKPEDYKAIGLWGAFMHSFSYYVEFQQILAAENDAPLDAIYKSSAGEWRTIRDLSKDHPVVKEFSRV